MPYLPTKPTSWTDLDMDWTELHLKPFDPYFVAIGQAIYERAVAVGREGDISYIALIEDPDPIDILYRGAGVEVFVRVVEDAIDSLIPYYSNPSTKDPWTEAEILTEIGAAQRYDTNWYTLAEWAKQQYDIINKLTRLNYEWDRSTVASRDIFRRRSGGSFTSMAAAVSAYNASSWIPGGSLDQNILYGFKTSSPDQWTVRGNDQYFLVRSSVVNTNDIMDVYIRYATAGGYDFDINARTIEDNVLYLEQEDQVYSPVYPKGGFNYHFIGNVIPTPATVNVSQFPNENDGVVLNEVELRYRSPDPSFNFTA